MLHGVISQSFAMKSLVIVLALALRAASIAVPDAHLHRRQALEPAAINSSVPVPVSDPFYHPAADSLAALKPGTIIASRAVNTTVARLAQTGGQSVIAHQISYRTTGPVGEPVSAVTTLFVPSNARRENELVACALNRVDGFG